MQPKYWRVRLHGEDLEHTMTQYNTALVDVNATQVGFPSRAAAAFVRDVKAGVAAYFEASGRSSKGNWAM
jgi:hypothetical protein